MQPEVKLSNFMFHLKFSSKEDYVHEHELYEVMQSRNLYQVQFGVRSNLKKLMRIIAINEKSQKYGFENTRKLFVQKMRERREQADHLRKMSELYKAKFFLDKDEENTKLERRYVPVPATTTIYSEFPAIVPKFASPTQNTSDDAGSDYSSKQTTTLHAPPTPSMIDTVYSDNTAHTSEREEHQKQLLNNSLTAKYMVAGKNTAETKTVKSDTTYNKGKKTTTAEDVNGVDKGTIAEFDKNTCDEMVDEFNVITRDNGDDTEQAAFENRARKGRRKQHVSTTRIAGEATCHGNLHNDDQSAKVEEWAEKHGLMSKTNTEMEKDADFKRLLIDRPSKWAMSHLHHGIHHGIVDSNILDTRYKMILQSRNNLNKQVNRKLKPTDHLSEKLKLNTNTYISLPDLDTKAKPMVTMHPGGSTPDGRLILTKADYEDYLSGYRKARIIRLNRAKKQTRNLEKLVEKFTIEPKLKLKDDTAVVSVIAVKTE